MVIVRLGKDVTFRGKSDMAVLRVCIDVKLLILKG